MTKTLEPEWRMAVKGLLRVEMTRRRMTYADLSKALANWGVVADERNIRNKVSRGTFSAAFMLQCLAAMECKALRLEECVEEMRVKVSAG